MEDFCTQKSSYFYHKILSKTQKLCTFLTSTDFKAFLYVNPLINFNNSKNKPIDLYIGYIFCFIAILVHSLLCPVEPPL